MILRRRQSKTKDDEDPEGVFDPMWSYLLEDYGEDEGPWNPCGPPYKRFRGWRDRRKERKRLRVEEESRASSSTLSSLSIFSCF